MYQGVDHDFWALGGNHNAGGKCPKWEKQYLSGGWMGLRRLSGATLGADG
jgi:hypothetical protein